MPGQGARRGLVEAHPGGAELPQVLSSNCQSWGWSQLEDQVATELGVVEARERRPQH